MRYPDGRPDHIEDYLITVRKGQWFGWSDPDNRIYANLVVHDGGSKPSESDCTNGLATLQAAWDLEYDSYKSQRRLGVGSTTGYPRIELQLDQLYHDMTDGKLGAGATTGSWYVGITSVKTAFPKP
tara:strand:+ start:677 stop:1054 length:378 start_codon:yes stop_codon:yes gene_type:complete